MRIHESVISRITCGTDRYAPITLPETFEIFPPQAEGENLPQADSDQARGVQAVGATVATAQTTARTQVALAEGSLPMVDNALRNRLEDRQVQQARAAAFEQVWDLVWWRRIAYFVTVAFTLLLVTMPVWSHSVPKLFPSRRAHLDRRAPPRRWRRAAGIRGAVDRCVRRQPVLLHRAVGLHLDHDALQRRLRAAAARPRQQDLARRPRHRCPAAQGSTESRLARFRNSLGYQRKMQAFKWGSCRFVFIGLIALTTLWLGLAGLTRAVLPTMEGGTTLCPSAGEQLQALQHYGGRFAPSATCHVVGQMVAKDARYRVELRVEDLWFDGRHPTNPLGLRARDLGAIGILGGPFRRVIEANYLQPVVEIRRRRSWPFDSVHINPLVLEEQQPGLFAGEFKATQDGELFLFANDAVWLPEPTYFYQEKPGVNSGSARLTIVRLEEAPIAAVRPAAIQAQAGR